MTTGLMPQSLVISFPNLVEIKDLTVTGFKSTDFINDLQLSSSNYSLILSIQVRNILVEKSVRSHPHEFEAFAEKCKQNSD
jgi:hypothetical protein